MEIFASDLHPSFAEALAALPSQRAGKFDPAAQTRTLRQRFGGSPPPPAPSPTPAPSRSVPSAELRRIASIPKNEPSVRAYFGALAELAERGEATEPTDRLYLHGLNDAIDAYLRFDERRGRVESALRKIGSFDAFQGEKRDLEERLARVRDEVARQVLRNALDQLESRAATFDALQTDLERIEARKAIIAQSLAAVRERLILDSLNTGEGTADGGGLRLLRSLNDDLAQDALFAQQAEAEHILQSIVP